MQGTDQSTYPEYTCSQKASIIYAFTCDIFWHSLKCNFLDFQLQRTHTQDVMCGFVNVCFDLLQRAGAITALIMPVYEGNTNQQQRREEEVPFYIFTAGRNKESYQKLLLSHGS